MTPRQLAAIKADWLGDPEAYDLAAFARERWPLHAPELAAFAQVELARRAALKDSQEGTLAAVQAAQTARLVKLTASGAKPPRALVELVSALSLARLVEVLGAALGEKKEKLK